MLINKKIAYYIELIFNKTYSMKKYLIIIILSSLSCINIYSQNLNNDSVINDLKNDELRGKVKSVIFKVFNFDEIYKGNLEKFNYYFYNEDERYTEIFEYLSDSSLLSREIFKYDKKGNLIEKKEFGYNDSIKNKSIYTYNQNGLLTEEDFYWVDIFKYYNGDTTQEFQNNSKLELRYKTIYKYDDKGHLLEEIVNNSDSSLYYKHKYKYDDKGRLIEDILKYKTVYKYDNNGDTIEYLYYDLDGSLYRKEICEYNKKRNLIKKNIENETWIYKYNRKGIRLKVEMYVDGKLKYIEKYNKRGYLTESIDYKNNEKEIIEYDNNDNIIKDIFKESYITRVYYYEYDKQGNWVKVTHIEDSKVVQIHERKIEYYE